MKCNKQFVNIFWVQIQNVETIWQRITGTHVNFTRNILCKMQRLYVSMKLSEVSVWWNQPITREPKYIPSLIWHLYFQIHIANSMTWFFWVYPRVFRRSVDDTSHLFVRPIHYGFANFDIGKARYKWGGQVEIRILVGNNSIVTSYVASKGHVHVC